MTGLPIIVRGIMNPLDAMAAAGAGASAVWVTGNFSGGASPISVMRQIVVTLRGHHISTEVFMSGGIRRGTDVLKAIAFGATAVFLDPETPLWALYQGQEEGLNTMLEMLNEELRLSMVLTHCLEVADITDKHVIHMLKIDNVLARM